jgi:hypothetical protein
MYSNAFVLYDLKRAEEYLRGWYCSIKFYVQRVGLYVLVLEVNKVK